MRTYWLYGKENYDKELPDFSKLTADDLPRPFNLPITQGKMKKDSGFDETITNGFLQPKEKVANGLPPVDK